MTAPLDGIRVLDFSRVYSGPHCGRMLVDLGADVIKIEPPAGDLTRVFEPRINSLSLYHVQQNCGKRNISLDLERPEAQPLLLRMAETADVVLENFRPGVMARMGLGYDTLSAVNPRLVYASITGYGQEGPWSDRRAYARSVQAEIGMMRTEADSNGGPPQNNAFSHADVYTSLECLSAILAALYQRERTGVGQRIDVAMADTMLCVNEHLADDLFSHEHGVATGSAGRGHDPVVQTADGQWLCVVGNPCAAEGFPFFCRAIDRLDLLDDPRFSDRPRREANRDELVAIIADAVLGMGSLDEVEAAFAEHRLATGRVRSLEEVVETPWAKQRGVTVAVSDRAGGRVRIPNSPWRFSAAETGVRGEPAYRGEHNREVLTEVLGLDGATLDQLTANGVLTSRGPRRPPASS